jgi:hypothetical protein
MPVIWVNRVEDTTNIIKKMEGRGGGGEAQGFADPPPPPLKKTTYFAYFCGPKLCER